jgi:hypothetical protein
VPTACGGVRERGFGFGELALKLGDNRHGSPLRDGWISGAEYLGEDRAPVEQVAKARRNHDPHPVLSRRTPLNPRH